MATRKELLEAIANKCADYREDDFGPMTPEHVDRWVSQFDKGVQESLLSELDHVLASTYFSRESIESFLKHLVTNTKLAGNDPCSFWKAAHFLRIQLQGHSQVEMLGVFDNALKSTCNFKTVDCGRKGGVFIYLDDVIFSGDRVSNDFAKWVTETAPAEAVVHVVVAAIHTGGEYWLTKAKKSRLQTMLKESGKKIDISWWRSMNFENRKAYNASSDVLWPAELPKDAALAKYQNEHSKYPFEKRSPGGKSRLFSSEAGRKLLETELLMAGVKICSYSKEPSEVVRPLGYSPFGLGFGSMIVTFRNCPNNCPLALWWGDPKKPASHPFSKWYPLFPRKTYKKD